MPEIKQDIRAATFIVAANDSVHKNMADYVCDGVNDQVEINTALAALPVGGGEVHLLEGTYIVSDSITIGNSQSLTGCGANTVIKIVDGDATGFHVVVNSDPVGGNNRILLKSFKIDGNRDNVTGWNYGIFMDNVGSGTGAAAVPGCKIEGVWVEACVYGGISLEDCVNSAILGCVCCRHYYCIKLVKVTRTSIVGSILQGADGTGLYAEQATYCNISNNIIDGNTEDGIYLMVASDYCTISGNLIVSNQTGISLGGHYHVVDNNLVDTTTGFDGIILESDHCLIIGNMVRKCHHSGIRIVSSTNNSILGNVVVENSQATDDTYDNIRLLDSDDILIANNFCRRGALANKPKYGINISTATCDRNKVVDNDLYDSGSTGAINDAGTNTKLPSITVPFSHGSDPQDSGMLINVGAEFARAWLFLNKEVVQVVRMKVYARSAVLEADKMRAEFVIYGGADNEAYNTHNGSVANHPSTSTNFAADDVIYWIITTAGVLTLLGNDSVEVKVLHEIAGGADCETNAYLRTVTIEYV